MSTVEESRNQDWFHVHYSKSANPGLPPVVQADRFVRYRDVDGTWLVALWGRPGADRDAVSACVLRIPADHVVSVTHHPDMGAAMRAHLRE